MRNVSGVRLVVCQRSVIQWCVCQEYKRCYFLRHMRHFAVTKHAPGYVNGKMSEAPFQMFIFIVTINVEIECNMFFTFHASCSFPNISEKYFRVFNLLFYIFLFSLFCFILIISSLSSFLTFLYISFYLFSFFFYFFLSFFFLSYFFFVLTFLFLLTFFLYMFSIIFFLNFCVLMFF